MVQYFSKESLDVSQFFFSDFCSCFCNDKPLRNAYYKSIVNGIYWYGFLQVYRMTSDYLKVTLQLFLAGDDIYEILINDRTSISISISVYSAC